MGRPSPRPAAAARRARGRTAARAVGGDGGGIGAGVVGLATAFFLARAGHDVMVIDAASAERDGLRRQCRQPARAAAVVRPRRKGRGWGLSCCPHAAAAARTRSRCGRPSSANRPRLRDPVTGGVMVAETEQDLRFLADKTALERAQGIESHLIDAAELERLEPASRARFPGRRLLRPRGQDQPAGRDPRLAQRCSRPAGASHLRHDRPHRIERDLTGLLVETSRGSSGPARCQRCRCVLFADRRDAGREVPVFGAPLQMIVTEAAEPIISRLVAHADRHLTLKQAANGNFIIGGGWTRRSGPRASASSANAAEPGGQSLGRAACRSRVAQAARHSELGGDEHRYRRRAHRWRASRAFPDSSTP